MKDVFPYFILLIPTYVIAVSFKRNDARVLVSLIAVEAIVVILERVAGISTFDRSLPGYMVFNGGELAYFQRPLGLSESSSLIASKLLIAWLFIDYFRLKEWFFALVKILIGVAILITFNRSVIMSLGVYWVLRNASHFMKMRYTVDNAIKGTIGTVVVIVGVVVGLVLKGESILNQFTRNQGTVELTGREYIWLDFFEFIKEHLLFGNNSIKLWLDSYHAHNSYLELIATNGIFISALYFAFIYRNVRWSNGLYILPILIFGLTQYAFFWGVSIVDIVLWVILFDSYHKNQKEKTNLLFLKEPQFLSTKPEEGWK
ncbi:hypothetical protein KFE94_04155 [bacterium SCSIO 12643]|nr:hypothetical protein KFE94_04155 [bacterium SCSIO 12643]